MPATYASNIRVFEMISPLISSFDIRSILDLGAGPGTATLAALKHIPNISEINLVERSKLFLKYASDMIHCSIPNRNFKISAQEKSINDTLLPKSDLVIASYFFNELSEADTTLMIQKVLEATQQFLLFVEPGTTPGFKKLLLIRSLLLNLGAHIAAPCTHSQPCPMADSKKWCHFRVRFNRTRLHRTVKDGQVSYEDEPFSFLLVSKIPLKTPENRITSYPSREKGFITVETCSQDGSLLEQKIMKRNKELYSIIKELTWGDSF
jgi:ribosomal protein RSM22 (predicted rRNA methylase)